MGGHTGRAAAKLLDISNKKITSNIEELPSTTIHLIIKSVYRLQLIDWRFVINCVLAPLGTEWPRQTHTQLID